MRHTKSVAVLILIATVLLGSTANNADFASAASRRHQHETEATPQPKSVEQQQPQVPLSVWQSTNAALSESIRAQKEQSIANQKQAEASQQSWCSPPVVVNEILAAIGAGYLIFMGLQWSAIKQQGRSIQEQARIANDTLIETRRAADAATQSANAAKKTADLSEQALHLTEAADIEFDSIEYVTPPTLYIITTLTLDTRITVVLRNFGKTRASNLKVLSWLGIPGSQPKKGIQGPLPTTIVAAGQQFRITSDRIGDDLSAEELAKVMSGELKLRYGVTTTYKDIFGDSYRSRHLGTYKPPGREFLLDDNYVEKTDEQYEPDIDPRLS